MLDKKNVISDLTRWIDSMLCTPLTIEMIASRSGYSKWHIQRMFREIQDTSIGAYIRNKRLDQAAADLLSSGEEIIDISEKNGFVSQQSFTYMFIRKFGISPYSFRKINC
ncbi:helix-turn-helix domain-containing protein (plasmid) [Pantoea sp. C3]|uniref:helix-turn-helix domain-containing protein n=1 Tax=Pantoea phytostimulans TaxID=2769024 RepID=UPI0038F65C59